MLSDLDEDTIEKLYAIYKMDSSLLSDEIRYLIAPYFRGSYYGSTDPRDQSSAVNARKMLSDLDKDIIEKLLIEVVMKSQY